MIAQVGDFDDMQGRQPMLFPLLIDAFALPPSFRCCNNAIRRCMGGCWAVNVDELMHGYPTRSIMFHPIQYGLTAGFKGLHVNRFVLSHEVAGDMNFNGLTRSLSRIQKQTMPRMKAVEGSADQASAETMCITHGLWLACPPLRPSPHRGWWRWIHRLCPDA